VVLGVVRAVVLRVVLSVVLGVVLGVVLAVELGVVLGGSSTATEAVETEAADAFCPNKLLICGVL
jgi:ABC-type nitrate/sulfonate/bicarbonate transport system permease component